MEVMIIKSSSDPKNVGNNFPQTVLLSKNETDDLEFLSTQKGKRIEKKISLNNILLSPGAILTDAISCSLGAGNDMIVSDKLYKLIKESNVDPVQFFDVSFKFNKEIITNYHWLHFVYELEPFINFKKTKYNVEQFPELKKNVITDYDTFKKFSEGKDKYGFLRSKKTVLLESFNQKLDLFVLSPIDQNIYISKLLYEKMIEWKITGLDYEEAVIEISN